MAGSKGACSSSYEILAGSFFFVSPIVCPIKEDPIVGKFRIVFLLSLSSLSQFDFVLGSNYYQDFTFLFLILVGKEEWWRRVLLDGTISSISNSRRNLLLLREKEISWRRCRVEISDGKLKLGPRIAPVRYWSLEAEINARRRGWFSPFLSRDLL